MIDRGTISDAVETTGSEQVRRCGRPLSEADREAIYIQVSATLGIPIDDVRAADRDRQDPEAA